MLSTFAKQVYSIYYCTQTSVQLLLTSKLLPKPMLCRCCYYVTLYVHLCIATLREAAGGAQFTFSIFARRNLLCSNVRKRLYNDLNSSSKRGKDRHFLCLLGGSLNICTVLKLLCNILFMRKPSNTDSQHVLLLHGTVRIPLYSHIRNSSS